MAITVKVEGLEKAILRLKNFTDGMPQALAGALNTEHEQIMNLAKSRTPVDTGALRASGHVQPPKVTNTKAESVGAFGGPSAPYGLFVHERLDVHHPVGQAKFYESAAIERKDNVSAAVKRAVEKKLRG